MAGELRHIAEKQQENGANLAPLGPLVEALAARLAAVEGDVIVLRAAARTAEIERDAAMLIVKDRLGQARNVEQRCKKLLETMRKLLAERL